MDNLKIFDLIIDEYGNHYSINSINNNKIEVVNALYRFSHNRIINSDFLEEIKSYDKRFSLYLRKTIEVALKVQEEKRGKIYSIADLKELGYNLEINQYI